MTGSWATGFGRTPAENVNNVEFQWLIAPRSESLDEVDDATEMRLFPLTVCALLLAESPTKPTLLFFLLLLVGIFSTESTELEETAAEIANACFSAFSSARVYASSM